MMNNVESKVGLILDLDNVQASERAAKYTAIDAYEEKVEVKMDCMKDATTSPYPTPIQTYMTQAEAIRGVLAGSYSRVYLVLKSPIESDYYRENAYPKTDRYGHMNLKERFNTEPHAQDERMQHPEKWGHIDTRLHWFCAQTSNKADIVYIDLSVENPQAFSVSEEYFAPVDHREYNQEEADWAIALGVSRKIAAEYLEFFKKEFPPTWEHHMYLMANGGSEFGTTPDAQVAKCPVCGRPTWAAPASVGSKDNYDATYRPTRVDSKQMTCEHCKADLSPVFSK